MARRCGGMRAIVQVILAIFVLQIIALIFQPWRLNKISQWINQVSTKQQVDNQTQPDASRYWDLENPPPFEQFEYFWPAPDVFAYVWVADGFDEICSALTAFKQLKSFLAPKPQRDDIDYILMYPSDLDWISQNEAIQLLEKWTELDGILEEVEIKLEHIRQDAVLRKNRLTTHAFSLMEYDKILLLNANGIVLGNMDHLFTQKEENVAQALLSAAKHSIQELTHPQSKPCFGPQSPWVATSLLMFQPLPSTRDRIIQYTRGQSGIWSVESAINYEFACNDELNVLPSKYLLEMGAHKFKLSRAVKDYFFVVPHAITDIERLSREEIELFSGWRRNRSQTCEINEFAH
ncbi:uncharacterized protein LOC131889197 isoform X1 [Tigriopus californicus]|nr:uncharacterized protein LOC131889197 isoform X1 [Tigriopus californicus]XP_059094217.1 uncharacterized protein LOC131889197 isoform X1 [Tigriopus californicus]